MLFPVQNSWCIHMPTKYAGNIKLSITCEATTVSFISWFVRCPNEKWIILTSPHTPARHDHKGDMMDDLVASRTYPVLSSARRMSVGLSILVHFLVLHIQTMTVSSTWLLLGGVSVGLPVILSGSRRNHWSHQII
jgi:hypothetical protein